MISYFPDVTTMFAFGIAAIALAITPGPDMALFISRTISFGVKHGILTSIGALSGVLVHILLASFGISLLIMTAPGALFILKIAGALYLLWLAYSALKSGSVLAVSKKQGTEPSYAASYFTGLGINLTNPKVLLFFITFFPQFVTHEDVNATYKLLFLGVEFIIISTPICLAIVFGAQWLTKTLVNNPRMQNILNYFFAAVFAIFAVTILFAQVSS